MTCAKTSRTKPKFRADERGATMVMFALIFMPMLGLTFTAIDFGRVYYARNKLQAAVDAAAAAGGQHLGSPHELIGETINAFMKANLSEKHKMPIYEVAIAPNDTSVTVRMKDSIATTVAGIVGVPRLDFAVEATAERPAPVIVPDIEQAADQPTAPASAPAIDRAPTQEEAREAEEVVREVMREIESGGGHLELRRLLRGLRR